MPKRLALIGDHVCDWLSYGDTPIGTHDVRIATEYASGKYGTWAALMDASTFGGERFDIDRRMFVASESDASPATVSREKPISFGTSTVGVVSEIGSGVKSVRVGERVFAINADIRETNTMNAAYVHALGDLSPTLALCAEPAYVSFHCVRESNVRFGETVLVVGLGALGLIAVAMAHESGAERVIAVDMSSGRRRMAESLGADISFDPREGDTAARVHDILGGTGVDVAIELSGASAGLATAIRSCRVGGTVCAAGFYRTDAHGVFLGREFHHNRLTMIVPHGCGFGHPPRDIPRWDERRAVAAILSMMRQGKLNVGGIVDPVVGTAEALDMFRRMRDEPDAIVKFAVKF
ncbi:MAG: zinc-binding alcohol dehydrogenase [Spirochaetota bacterium]